MCKTFIAQEEVELAHLYSFFRTGVVGSTNAVKFSSLASHSVLLVEAAFRSMPRASAMVRIAGSSESRSALLITDAALAVHNDLQNGVVDGVIVDDFHVAVFKARHLVGA